MAQETGGQTLVEYLISGLYVSLLHMERAMSDEGTYEVGYCKPPRHTQFQKGQSGNPKGRPEKPTTFAALMERELNKRVPVTENGRKRLITVRELVVRMIINDAAKRDPKAREVVLRHLRESMTPEPVTFTSHDQDVVRMALAALGAELQAVTASAEEDRDVRA